MGVFIRGWVSHYASTHWTSTVVTPPTVEPLTITDMKARGRIFGNDEDGLIHAYIKAARNQVEQDTGIALLTQTRDVFFDGGGLGGSVPFDLPWPPLQSVTWIKTYSTAGVQSTWDASNYHVDASSMPARIALTDAGIWPTDLRVFQPWSLRMVVGWTSPDLIPPALREAVGLLAVHRATIGRDLALEGMTASVVPYGYAEMIAPYQRVSVA